MKHQPRAVRIDLIEKSPRCRFYAVVFMNRRPRQHHWAAQFDANQNTLEFVTGWVQRNPKLKLIEA